MIPMNNKCEIDYQLISLRIITHAIRKQTAIDALTRLDNRLASVPPSRFRMAGRMYGKTTRINQMIWRINNERAYLESVANEGWEL